MLHTIKLLYFSETKEENELEEVLTPTIDLPNVFELTYYANTVTCTFALESVIGNHSKDGHFYVSQLSVRF